MYNITDKAPVVIFSVHQRYADPIVNSTAHAQVRRSLVATGLPFKEVAGFVGGVWEESFVVGDDETAGALETIIELASTYNQKEVLKLHEGGRGGIRDAYRYIITDTPVGREIQVKYAGVWQPVYAPNKAEPHTYDPVLDQRYVIRPKVEYEYGVA